MVITQVIATEKFEKDVKKIKDKMIRERIDSEVKKICKNPDFGKGLRYGLKGEMTVRIAPYRMIYAVDDSKLILLRFEHRGDVYN
jgi:mRNA-degrading endonuclease RelE of RelBE toxin-antitoxin system